MIGLVLWFNPTARVGMVWCEDQGPLAILEPGVALPEGQHGLACGDQISFSVTLRNDVRFVRDVVAVMPALPGSDPPAIISGYRRGADDGGHLSVVA